MNRYTIPPSILLIVLFILYIATKEGYILWIQGSTNISVLMIVWQLFLITILIEIIYLIKAYKARYLFLFFAVVGVIIGISVSLEIKSATTRYYYEQSNHQILVVDSKKLNYGDIKFYYKDNLGFSKEFTSCLQNVGVTCNYYIEEDNLIINIVYSNSDEREIVTPIPFE